MIKMVRNDKYNKFQPFYVGSLEVIELYGIKHFETSCGELSMVQLVGQAIKLHLQLLVTILGGTLLYVHKP